MTVPSLFGDSQSEKGPAAITAPANEPRRVATTSTSSLYRKYRPQSFDSDELVGQEHIVRTLQNAVRLDRVAHAYLFCGPRGTGKTTTARVLAKAINCLQDDPACGPATHARTAWPSMPAHRPTSSRSTPPATAASTTSGISGSASGTHPRSFAPRSISSMNLTRSPVPRQTPSSRRWKSRQPILASSSPPPTRKNSFRRSSLAARGSTSGGSISTTSFVGCRPSRRSKASRLTADALRLIARHATGSLRDALGLFERLALGTDISREESAIRLDHCPGRHRRARFEQERSRRRARRGDWTPGAGEALRVVQEAVDDGKTHVSSTGSFWPISDCSCGTIGGTGDADTRARELAAMFSLSELAAMARRFGEIDFSIKHAPYPQLPLEVALVEAVAIAAPDPVRSQAGERPHDHAHSDPAAAAPAPPTSLRDRVRAPTSLREIPPQEPAGPGRPNPRRLRRSAQCRSRRRLPRVAGRPRFLRDRSNRGALAKCARGRQGAEPANRGAAERSRSGCNLRQPDHACGALPLSPRQAQQRRRARDSGGRLSRLLGQRHFAAMHPAQ